MYMLLASIVYHEQYLREQCPLHPIFTTPLFTTAGMITSLKDKVITGSGKNLTSGMIATGIPPHILLGNEVVNVCKGMDVLRETIMENLIQLPDKTKDLILNNFQINGVLPITQEQFSDFKNDMRTLILQTQSLNVTSTQNENDSTMINGNYHFFNWGGKLHNVPEGFRFPKKCHISNLWNLWIIGNISFHICPYRKIYSQSLLKSDRTLKSKADYVMNFIKNQLQIELTFEELSKLSQEMRDEHFKFGNHKLWQFLYPHKSSDDLDTMRVGERSYSTVYDNIRNELKRTTGINPK
jgi:hypothetical protein